MSDISHPIIEASKLYKSYYVKSLEVHALNGVDIIVQAGEKVAVMGTSGSGKSTLLHLIGGLDSPTSGDIYVNGQELSIMNDSQLSRYRNRNVGFVFQDFNLVDFVSVTDNIAMPLRISGISSNEATHKAAALLQELQMSELASRLPYQLSGGQKQRVAIARAMASSPSIILADEPTANLDSKNAEIVLSMLQSLQLGSDKALVIATHNKDVAERMDRVVYLSDGKVGNLQNMVW